MHKGAILATVALLFAACGGPSSSATPSAQPPDASGFDARNETFCRNAPVAAGMALGVRSGWTLSPVELVNELERDASALDQAGMGEEASIVRGLSSELASVPEDELVLEAFLDDPVAPQVMTSVRDLLADEPHLGAVSFRSQQEASRLMHKLWAGETWLSDSITLPASFVAETSDAVPDRLITQLEAIDGVRGTQVLGGSVDPDRVAAFRLATLVLCPGIDLPPPDPQ